MKYEEEKALIKDIINREKMVEINYDLKYMTEEEKEEYKNYTNKMDEIFQKLIHSLDKEDKKMIYELEESFTAQMNLESSYYFERGVLVGLGCLRYLNKYFNHCFEI